MAGSSVPFRLPDIFGTRGGIPGSSEALGANADYRNGLCRAPSRPGDCGPPRTGRPARVGCDIATPRFDIAGRLA